MTRQPYRKAERLWQIKAREEKRLDLDRQPGQGGAPAQPKREEALDAWKKIAWALANSERHEDQVLATQIVGFLREGPVRRKAKVPEQNLERTAKAREREQTLERVRAVVERDRGGPEMEPVRNFVCEA